jgi:hypothetical protein
MSEREESKLVVVFNVRLTTSDKDIITISSFLVNSTFATDDESV